jgi:hypothetical protein
MISQGRKVSCAPLDLNLDVYSRVVAGHLKAGSGLWCLR